MGEFKKMVKMETTEPSVILNLKKGGHVGMKHKAEHGHKPMAEHKTTNRFRAPDLSSDDSVGVPPMKPSMSERNRAMKKGGMVESRAHERQEMKELKSIKHAVMKRAEGGMTAPMKKTTEKDPVAKPFVQSKVETAGKDRAHGTGEVKEANAGGFKKGGEVSMHMSHAERYLAHHAKHGTKHSMRQAKHHLAMAKKYADGGTVKDSAAKPFEMSKVETAGKDKAHGTGEVKESNAGGYARGGVVGQHADWENRPADSARPGVKGRMTGEVREGNAGGFKGGGNVGAQIPARRAKGGTAGERIATRAGAKIPDIEGGLSKDSKNPFPAVDYDPMGSTGNKTPDIKRARKYADGGKVQRDGGAETMPARPVRGSVSNDRRTGVYKRGGKVCKAEGGSMEGE